MTRSLSSANCVDAVATSLARIASTEPIIHAWAHVATTDAYDQARRLDRGSPRGPLHGVPIGVKDVIPCAGMPLGHGYPQRSPRIPRSDAACVAALRSSGAVVIGKTATTEFTLMAPSKTRNPHDPSRTAGQSSGGSAAAVASGSVSLAIGTQTGGSVTRPAAYCGVVGFKPSYGLVGLADSFSLSRSLDTIGIFAKGVRDAGDVSAVIGATSSRRRQGAGRPPPRLGFCRTTAWQLADAPVTSRIEQLLARLEREGADIGTVGVDRHLDDAVAVSRLIVRYEGSRALRSYLSDLDEMGDTVREFLRDAESVSTSDYEASLAAAGRMRRTFEVMIAPFDALITLSTLSEAPPVGDPDPDRTLNSAWTLVRAPTVSLPIGTGPSGLPLGVQLVGAPMDDRTLLACAGWVEEQVSRMRDDDPPSRLRRRHGSVAGGWS